MLVFIPAVAEEYKTHLLGFTIIMKILAIMHLLVIG